MSNDFNEDYLVSSPDYSAVMENRVIPGLDLRREDRILRGTDQTPLFCSVFRADDRFVIVGTCRAEALCQAAAGDIEQRIVRADDGNGSAVFHAAD